MARRAALRIAVIYGVLAGFWIAASDSLALWLVPDAVSRYHLSVGKGFFFIGLTGSVLFFLVQRAAQKLEQEGRRLAKVNEALISNDQVLQEALAEKQRLNAELESRISRGQSLEAQLLQAQKLEGVGRLAGGVAHDFNNMLTVILGAAELLPDEVTTPAGLALVEEIRKGAERCAALTRQLLIFSRKHIAQQELLDLNAQVSEAQKMLLRLIGEDIRFTTTLQSEPAVVRLDPVHLQQLVVNLVVNARDAMPDGGSLSLETETRTFGAAELEGHPGVAPGPFVVLTVSDTGGGMSSETLAHMFEPFFTTKPEGKGTGLGLATVYGIVQQGGGFLSVKSALKQGTTFRVHLPLVAGAARDQVGGHKLIAVAGGRERILLVEDEDALRTMMRHSLKHLGYSVLEAKNAGEALLIFEQSPEPIQILVADVVLPIMRGSLLAARLRSLKPDLRVLLMSGYAAELETDLERAQAHGFLRKPFAADVLTRRVREILDSPPG